MFPMGISQLSKEKRQLLFSWTYFKSDVWWRSDRTGITCLLAHDSLASLQTSGYIHLCKDKVLGFISDFLDHSQGTFADLPWLTKINTSHSKFYNTERSIKSAHNNPEKKPTTESHFWCMLIFLYHNTQEHNSHAKCFM